LFASKPLTKEEKERLKQKKLEEPIPTKIIDEDQIKLYKEKKQAEEKYGRELVEELEDKIKYKELTTIIEGKPVEEQAREGLKESILLLLSPKKVLETKIRKAKINKQKIKQVSPDEKKKIKDYFKFRKIKERMLKRYYEHTKKQLIKKEKKIRMNDLKLAAQINLLVQDLLHHYSRDDALEIEKTIKQINILYRKLSEEGKIEVEPLIEKTFKKIEREFNLS
jgi:hypothetical protein